MMICGLNILVALLVNYLASLLFDHLWVLAFVSIVEIRCQVHVKQIIDAVKAFVKLRLIELMLIFTLDPLSKEVYNNIWAILQVVL